METIKPHSPKTGNILDQSRIVPGDYKLHYFVGADSHTQNLVLKFANR